MYGSLDVEQLQTYFKTYPDKRKLDSFFWSGKY